MNLFKWISFFSLLISCFCGFSQTDPNTKNARKDLILGMGITGTGFYGDLNYSPEGLFDSDFFSFYPGFDLSLRSDAPRRLLPMLHLGYAKFVAQNPDLLPVMHPGTDPLDPPLSIQPNTYAETAIVYGEIGLHLNVVRRYAQFRPYMEVSLGVLTFSPQSETGIPLVRRRSTRAPSEQTFEAITVSMPLSAGLDINLSRKIGLNLAYTYRFLGSDYLDNIADLGLHEGRDRLHSLRLGANFRLFDSGSSEPVRKRVPRKDVLASGNTPDRDESSGQLDPQLTIAANAGRDTVALPASTPDCDSLIDYYEARLAELRAERDQYKNMAETIADESSQFRREVDSLQQRIQGELISLNEELTKARIKDGVTVRELEALRVRVNEMEAEQRANEAQDMGDVTSMSVVKAENVKLLGEIEKLKEEMQLLQKGAALETMMTPFLARSGAVQLREFTLVFEADPQPLIDKTISHFAHLGYSYTGLDQWLNYRNVRLLRMSTQAYDIHLNSDKENSKYQVRFRLRDNRQLPIEQMAKEAEKAHTYFKELLGI